MSQIEEIKATIEALDPADFVHLRQWFLERDWEKWDRQIEADAESGKLDFLVAEARDEKRQGKLQDL